MKIKVLIETVDRAGILFEKSWLLQRSSGSAIDIARFDLDDQAANIIVNRGDEVIVEDDADATIRFFGGFVASRHARRRGLGRILSILTQDFKLLLDKGIVTKVYEDTADNTIITDAFSQAGLTEINTTTKVKFGKTIDRLSLKGTTLRVLMDRLASISGYIWDVDSFKNLIYRPPEDTEAAFEFSDVPNNTTTFPYSNFDRGVELGNFNAVEVIGAVNLSANVTQIYGNTGGVKVFNISAEEAEDKQPITHAPTTSTRIEINKNVGTEGSPDYVGGGASQVVGIEGVDPLVNVDVLYNPLTGRTEWAVAPPSNATQSWQIIGRYRRPLRILAEDPDAIDALGGRKFTKALPVPELDDLDTGIDVALAFLNEQTDRDTIEIDFDHDGLDVDVFIRFTSALEGLTQTKYLVEELRTTFLGGTVSGYSALLRVLPSLKVGA